MMATCSISIVFFVLLFVPYSLQHLEGDYGMYTWPCAPVLAQYVYSNREFIRSKKVLEVRLVYAYGLHCMHAIM